MGWLSALGKILGVAAAPFTGGGSLALTAASALGGALSNRGGKTTSNSTYNNTSTSTPQLSPEQEAIYGLLSQNVMNRLRGQTPLAGYEASGLQNINESSDAIRRSIEGRLTSRGLIGSPMGATALSNLDISRGSEAAKFRNSLPLLQNDLDLQNLGAAGTVFGLRPFGETRTSSGTGTGVSTTSGNMLGGAFGGLAEALGYLIGRGSFGPRSNPGGSGGQSSGNPLSSMGVPGGYGSPLAPKPPGLDIAALLRALGGLT